MKRKKKKNRILKFIISLIIVLGYFIRRLTKICDFLYVIYWFFKETLKIIGMFIYYVIVFLKNNFIDFYEYLKSIENLNIKIPFIIIIVIFCWVFYNIYKW